MQIIEKSKRPFVIIYSLNGIKICELELNEPRYLFQTLSELGRGYENFSKGVKKVADKIDCSLDLELRKLVEHNNWSYRESCLVYKFMN